MKKRTRKKTREPVVPAAPAASASPDSTLSTGVPLWHRVAWWAGLGILALCFAILKTYGMNPYAGDEYIYFYQGQMVAEGLIPYRDFAMAHPPLQSLFTALLFGVAGYSFVLARLMPFLWCLTAGLVLAFTVRRELGIPAALAAMGVYLFSYEPFRAATHFTGVNMTVALLLLAVFFFRKKWFVTCAAFCVAAVFTRLYAIPGVMALVIWALLSNRREGLRLVLYGSAIGAAVFLAVGLWTGFGDMIHNMVAYHAQKTPMKPEQLLSMKNTVLFHNAVPLGLFLLGLPLLFVTISRKFQRVEKGAKKSGIYRRFRNAVRASGAALPLLCVLIVLLFGGILLSMDRIWMYYFVPLFPFGAVVAGMLAGNWVDFGAGLIRRRGDLHGYGLELIFLSILLVLSGLVLVLSPRLETRVTYYQREIVKSEADRTHSYEWKPSPYLPAALDDLVRRVVWKDIRIIGEPYPQINYAMWHESRHLDVTEEVAKDIARWTEPGDTIFGDSGTVPLFALESGRRIAGNEVDTNGQRYRSGNADPKEVVRRIDGPETKIIVFRMRSRSRGFGVAGIGEFRSLVARKYKIRKTYRTADGKSFYLFVRK